MPCLLFDSSSTGFQSSDVSHASPRRKMPAPVTAAAHRLDVDVIPQRRVVVVGGVRGDVELDGRGRVCGAVQSMVQLFAPAVGTREPARLCWTNVSTWSTAPGISCTRASSGFQTPACFPFCFPLANLAAISNPPRRRPSRLIVTVIGYVCPAANEDGTPSASQIRLAH